MLILGLESSTATASCALAADGKQIALYTQNSGLTHSTTLLPMVEDMLRNTGTDKRELSAIAVSVGPGSFTGIRIGCATAKGLSFALGIPCRPVSALAAIAAECGISENCIVSAEIDARNSFLYNALFKRTSNALERLTPDRVITADDLRRELGNLSLITYHLSQTTAWGVCLAAENAPDAEPVPVYLRPSQAERVLAERGAQ